MTQKNIKREIWIDYAKTILIFLMVLGHNSLPYIESKLIYAFHMPAFFILSGYLYKPKKWYKTLKCMLIPILFFHSSDLYFIF